MRTQRVNKSFQQQAKWRSLFKSINADMSKATDEDASERNLLALACWGLLKLSLVNAESKVSGIGIVDPTNLDLPGPFDYAILPWSPC